MKTLATKTLPPPVVEALAGVQRAIADRQQLDAVIQNLKTVDEPAAVRAISDQQAALDALDIEIAGADLAGDQAAYDRFAAARVELVDDLQQKNDALDRNRRAQRGALAKAAALDRVIVEAGAALEAVCAPFRATIAERFRSDLIAAADALAHVLMTGFALRTALPGIFERDRIEEVIIPDLVAPRAPGSIASPKLIAGGRHFTGDGVTPVNLAAAWLDTPAIASVADLLRPLGLAGTIAARTRAGVAAADAEQRRIETPPPARERRPAVTSEEAAAWVAERDQKRDAAFTTPGSRDGISYSDYRARPRVLPVTA